LNVNNGQADPAVAQERKGERSAARSATTRIVKSTTERVRINDCLFALGFESANLRKRVARIPVLGVHGSSLGKAADLTDGGLMR
jgi:hypothetical protein